MIEELNYYNKKLTVVEHLKKWFLALSIIFILGSIVGIILSAVLPIFFATLEGIESGAITDTTTNEEFEQYFETTPHYIAMNILLIFFAVLFIVGIVLMALRFTLLVAKGNKYLKLLKNANKIDMENRHRHKHVINT